MYAIRSYYALFPGGHGHADPGNYAEVVNDYPATAALTHIRGENCHGPNDTPIGHAGVPSDTRFSLSADVCGICHGEPPRHGRYQQWQESGHGNFELAIGEGVITSYSIHYTKLYELLRAFLPGLYMGSSSGSRLL